MGCYKDRFIGEGGKRGERGKKFRHKTAVEERGVCGVGRGYEKECIVEENVYVKSCVRDEKKQNQQINQKQIKTIWRVNEMRIEKERRGKKSERREKRNEKWRKMEWWGKVGEIDRWKEELNKNERKSGRRNECMKEKYKCKQRQQWMN